MKIALVCRTYPTHRPGGMPHVVQDRARALARLGHEVHVFTTRGSARGGARNTDDYGVRVCHLRCPSQKYTEAFAVECKRAAARFRPDILHVDGFDRARPWFLDRPGSPGCVAITMHGFGLGSMLSTWNLHLAGRGKPPRLDVQVLREERAILVGADVAIGISRQEHWQLADVYALPNARLVYNPIAPEFFAGSPSPASPSAPLLFAGNPGTSGPRALDLLRKAAAAAGRPLKEATGRVPRAKMPAVYDGASALVLPTHWAQGYDLTVAEATARARPTIASHTGSYAREAERCPWIVTVPRGDMRALVAALRAPLPAVPPTAARRHRPEVHAERWLAACGP